MKGAVMLSRSLGNKAATQLNRVILAYFNNLKVASAGIDDITCLACCRICDIRWVLYISETVGLSNSATRLHQGETVL